MRCLHKSCIGVQSVTPLELKLLRKQYNLTQAEFGSRLVPPVSRLTVYNWESGKFAIPVDIETRLTAADLLRPAGKPKETAKQEREREAHEKHLADHWRRMYRNTRAWPQASSHTKAMAWLASQGHVIPSFAYAGIVEDFPTILTDPNGEYPMTKEQSHAIMFSTPKQED